MKYILLVMLAIIGASPAYAQIEVKDVFGPYEPVEYSVKTAAESKSLWSIRPLDNQTQYTTRDYGHVQALWGQPGRYEIEATVITVDFDARDFNVIKYTRQFVLSGVAPPPPGPTPGPVPPNPPGPTPPPTPDIPNDKFDNLGARLDAEADKVNLQFDKRAAVAAIYRETSNEMLAGKILRIEDAASSIAAKEVALGLDASWLPVRKLVSNDGIKRSPLSWQDAIAWYMVVATGYNGGRFDGR